MIKTETTHTTPPLNSTILSLEQQEQFFHGHLAVDTITVRLPYPPSPSPAHNRHRPRVQRHPRAFLLGGQNIRTGEFYASDTPYYEADLSAILVDAPPSRPYRDRPCSPHHTSQAAAPFQGPGPRPQSLTPAPQQGQSTGISQGPWRGRNA